MSDIDNQPIRKSVTPGEAEANRSGQGLDVSAAEARQGRRSGRVLWILIASMVLIVGGYLVIYAVHAPGLASGPRGGAEATFDRKKADMFNADGGSAKADDPANPSKVPPGGSEVGNASPPR